jgi:hypothetical protein
MRSFTLSRKSCARCTASLSEYLVVESSKREREAEGERERERTKDEMREGERKRAKGGSRKKIG